VGYEEAGVDADLRGRQTQTVTVSHQDEHLVKL